jgi:hypothetical protein
MAEQAHSTGRWRPGDSKRYRGKTIRAHRAAFWGVHYKINEYGPLCKRFRSRAAARAAIDAVIEMRRARAGERGLRRIGSEITYRGYTIVRIEDGRHGGKRYNVRGHAGSPFRSLDVAVGAIDATADAVDAIGVEPAWDARPINFNK